MSCIFSAPTGLKKCHRKGWEEDNKKWEVTKREGHEKEMSD